MEISWYICSSNFCFIFPPKFSNWKWRIKKKIGNHQGNWSKIYTFETKISSQKNTTKTPKCRAKAVLFGILFLKNKIQSTNFKHTQPGAPRDKARIHCLAMSNQTTTSRKVLRRLPARICGMTVVLPAWNDGWILRKTGGLECDLRIMIYKELFVPDVFFEQPLSVLWFAIFEKISSFGGVAAVEFLAV